MKDRLILILALILCLINTILIMYLLNRINYIEEKNIQVHEYILNRLGA